LSHGQVDPGPKVAVKAKVLSKKGFDDGDQYGDEPDPWKPSLHRARPQPAERRLPNAVAAAAPWENPAERISAVDAGDLVYDPNDVPWFAQMDWSEAASLPVEEATQQGTVMPLGWADFGKALAAQPDSAQKTAAVAWYDAQSAVFAAREVSPVGVLLTRYPEGFTPRDRLAVRVTCKSLHDAKRDVAAGRSLRTPCYRVPFLLLDDSAVGSVGKGDDASVISIYRVAARGQNDQGFCSTLLADEAKLFARFLRQCDPGPRTFVTLTTRGCPNDLGDYYDVARIAFQGQGADGAYRVVMSVPDNLIGKVERRAERRGDAVAVTPEVALTVGGQALTLCANDLEFRTLAGPSFCRGVAALLGCDADQIKPAFADGAGCVVGETEKQHRARYKANRR
jgi:hypothetical protein